MCHFGVSFTMKHVIIEEASDGEKEREKKPDNSRRGQVRTIDHVDAS